MDVGADEVVKTAESLGVDSKIEPVPAIALGGLTNGVSPLEMAEAYATLAANGTCEGTGTGLANVRERLAHHFPGRHAFTIAQEGDRVVARLEVPAEGA